MTEEKVGQKNEGQKNDEQRHRVERRHLSVINFSVIYGCHADGKDPKRTLNSAKTNPD
jgi:hypothetical protein